MFEFADDVTGQRETLGRGSVSQGIVHVVGDVSDLDHSWHVDDPIPSGCTVHPLGMYLRGDEEVIVTDRGKPVARLSALDHSTDRLAELIAAGIVRPAKRTTRRAPKQRIQPKGSVSDLVAEQRR